MQKGATGAELRLTCAQESACSQASISQPGITGPFFLTCMDGNEACMPTRNFFVKSRNLSWISGKQMVIRGSESNQMERVFLGFSTIRIHILENFETSETYQKHSKLS